MIRHSLLFFFVFFLIPGCERFFCTVYRSLVIRLHAMIFFWLSEQKISVF